MVPEPLAALLLEHRNAHAPHYPPVANSDHGPMAYLAMHGLGIGRESIRRFSQSYRTRLARLPAPTLTVDPRSWHTHFGDATAYSALLAFFDKQIAVTGWQATVEEYLPMLISGWVRDAFHPLIRLGYGIEFEVPSEVAAGLAYMTCMGDDTVLAAKAQAAPTIDSAGDYFAALQRQRRALFARGPFNERYAQIMASVEMRPVAGPFETVMAPLSRTCLDVFDSTHDFFALHLVTASHAFRIASPFAGTDLSGLFSVGLGSAYLAIGAPDFHPARRFVQAPAIDAIAQRGDEHDIKLAYSCQAQGNALQDPAFAWCAASYLQDRLTSPRR